MSETPDQPAQELPTDVADAEKAASQELPTDVADAEAAKGVLMKLGHDAESAWQLVDKLWDEGFVLVKHGKPTQPAASSTPE